MAKVLCIGEEWTQQRPIRPDLFKSEFYFERDKYQLSELTDPTDDEIKYFYRFRSFLIKEYRFEGRPTPETISGATREVKVGLALNQSSDVTDEFVFTYGYFIVLESTPVTLEIDLTEIQETRIFIVLEYINGITLRDKLDKATSAVEIVELYLIGLIKLQQLNQRIEFTHYDFTINNILVYDSEPQEYIYGELRLTKPFGLIIIDYESTYCSKIDSTYLGVSVYDSVRTPGIYDPSFDHKHLLIVFRYYHLYELERFGFPRYYTQDIDDELSELINSSSVPRLHFDDFMEVIYRKGFKWGYAVTQSELENAYSKLLTLNLDELARSFTRIQHQFRESLLEILDMDYRVIPIHRLSEIDEIQYQLVTWAQLLDFQVNRSQLRRPSEVFATDPNLMNSILESSVTWFDSIRYDVTYSELVRLYRLMWAHLSAYKLQTLAVKPTQPTALIEAMIKLLNLTKRIV